LNIKCKQNFEFFRNSFIYIFQVEISYVDSYMRAIDKSKRIYQSGFFDLQSQMF